MVDYFDKILTKLTNGWLDHGRQSNIYEELQFLEHFIIRKQESAVVSDYLLIFSGYSETKQFKRGS